MVSKIPATAVSLSVDGLELELSAEERGVLLSAMTNYGSTLFFVDTSNRPIYNDDELDALMDGIIAKLSGETVNKLYGRFWRGAQTIPHLTQTEIVITSYSTNGDFWDSGSPEDLTIPVTGTYIVIFQLRWVATSAGYRFIRILLNGIPLAGDRRDAIQNTDMFVTATMNFDAGDVLTFLVYQNTGADLDVAFLNGYSPYISIVQVD